MRNKFNWLSFIAIILILSLNFSRSANAQNISNEGTEFWAVFPTHDPNNNTSLANMNIFIASKVNSEVTVSCGSYTETKTIPANTVVSFAVPRLNSYINASEANRLLGDRGIKIKVTPGKPPVAVYAHVYAGARSAATLVLPYEALGQKYYSMNYTQDGNGRNFLTLVAADDNTTLLLTEKNGNVKSITLDKAGDVYEYLSPTLVDLTGVYVEVDPSNSKCKRFAAFSGSTSTVISCASSRDPLLQQLYTTNSWGKTYAIAPFFSRKAIIRILAQEDNTNVSINGSSVTINKGAFFEVPSRSDAVLITSDKLISVAQYSLTQGCSNANGGSLAGDPDMILINPVEFSIKKITLFSSDNQAITEKYINVVIKTADRSTFKINGSAPNGTWALFPDNPEYSFIQIRVTQQSITLSANDGFNAIAYGFGSAESYGYSAGTSLASNQFLSVVSSQTKEEQISACINQVVSFKVTMPYALTRVIWKFEDGTPDYDDIDPKPLIKEVSGEKLYEYLIPVEKSYSVLGSQTIKATAYFPLTGNSCFVGSADFDFTFSVDAYPTANFSAKTEACQMSEVSFTDQSTANNAERIIKKWLWDFGDGTTSALQNPKHRFATSGDYKVKLIVATETGCFSDVFEKVIKIDPLPVVDFVANQSHCVSREIKFENKSTLTDGSIATVLWDFGDGTTSTANDPTHTWTATGDYTIKLTVNTSKGCSVTTNRVITINPLPVVDFIMPNICVSDGRATFINKTTIINGEGLTYSWDFGDVHSTAQNPNTSTEINGTHQFTQVGLYEISLTVKSDNGCVVVVKKQFRVNGAVMKAAFEVQNLDKLCSNNEVNFKDIATVDYGQITKIEWFFDAQNSTVPDIVDENPNLRENVAKIYTFKYPTFSNLASKSYTVKMRVYSGSLCFSELTKVITLYPEAVVDFSLSSNCLTDGRAQFVNSSSYAGLNSNLTYLWNFGDERATVANPNTSTEEVPTHFYKAAGTYTVTLTIASEYGCAKTIYKEIVIKGAVPIPDFSVANSDNLCSNSAVVFTDKATLAFGEVTRIDWYFDYLNNPNLVETDLNPGNRLSRKTYSHLYPTFGYPYTKEITVRMVVYSGNSCLTTIEKVITLKARPEIDFGMPIEICLEADAIKLIAIEKNNLQGSGSFSGNGVSKDGVFTPTRAGLGIHKIKYTFTVKDGCTVENEQLVTVNPTPIINAGADTYVYEGGERRLTSTANGANLTYKWFPSEGLDRDDVLNPVVKPVKDMVYTLTVRSEMGCVAVDEISVKLLRDLVVPNAFTPNGDGVNDLWNIKFIESYPKATVDIFDRGGKSIFSSKGYFEPFDGTFRGATVPVGVYYYIITLNNERKPITGVLTIIR